MRAGLGGPQARILVVSGTDTGVGKTVVTAAIAAAAGAAGRRVAVIKPGQTGVGPHGTDESDVDVVGRLAAPASAMTLASYPDPLAPLVAACTSGQPGLAREAVRAAVQAAAEHHDVVLVEGAGGLLVPMGPDPVARPGWTMADLGVDLGSPVVVVARAGLGTLNHTALTLEALQRRGLAAYVVIGAWPARPKLVHQTNLVDLPGELDGILPDGAGALPGAQFRAQAPTWLSARLYGTADAHLLRAGGGPAAVGVADAEADQ